MFFRNFLVDWDFQIVMEKPSQSSYNIYLAHMTMKFALLYSRTPPSLCLLCFVRM